MFEFIKKLVQPKKHNGNGATYPMLPNGMEPAV